MDETQNAGAVTPRVSAPPAASGMSAPAAAPAQQEQAGNGMVAVRGAVSTMLKRSRQAGTPRLPRIGATAPHRGDGSTTGAPSLHEGMGGAMRIGRKGPQAARAPGRSPLGGAGGTGVSPTPGALDASGGLDMGAGSEASAAPGAPAASPRRGWARPAPPYVRRGALAAMAAPTASRRAAGRSSATAFATCRPSAARPSRKTK